MPETADTIASFDHELRELVQAAIDNEITRPAIAGVIMALAADFNQSRPLLAAYADTPAK